MFHSPKPHQTRSKTAAEAARAAEAAAAGETSPQPTPGQQQNPPLPTTARSPPPPITEHEKAVDKFRSTRIRLDQILRKKKEELRLPEIALAILQVDDHFTALQNLDVPEDILTNMETQAINVLDKAFKKVRTFDPEIQTIEQIRAIKPQLTSTTPLTEQTSGAGNEDFEIIEGQAHSTPVTQPTQASNVRTAQPENNNPTQPPSNPPNNDAAVLPNPNTSGTTAERPTPQSRRSESRTSRYYDYLRSRSQTTSQSTGRGRGTTPRGSTTTPRGRTTAPRGSTTRGRGRGRGSTRTMSGLQTGNHNLFQRSSNNTGPSNTWQSGPSNSNTWQNGPYNSGQNSSNTWQNNTPNNQPNTWQNGPQNGWQGGHSYDAWNTASSASRGNSGSMPFRPGQDASMDPYGYFSHPSMYPQGGPGMASNAYDLPPPPSRAPFGNNEHANSWHNAFSGPSTSGQNSGPSHANAFDHPSWSNHNPPPNYNVPPPNLQRQAQLPALRRQLWKPVRRQQHGIRADKWPRRPRDTGTTGSGNNVPRMTWICSIDSTFQAHGRCLRLETFPLNTNTSTP